MDTGIREGSEISMYYDPLICKLATHGNTRQEAIDHMIEAVGARIWSHVSVLDSARRMYPALLAVA